jgi:hypothetical protein
MYSKKSLNSYYFTTKGFYVFFIPVKVPYKQIYSMAEKAGLKKKEAFGPILESGKLFGSGWIGIEVEKPASDRSDVMHVTGDYEMYEYKGPYKTLGKACKKISKERPGKKLCFNLYLDDPEKTRPEDLRTQILFR